MTLTLRAVSLNDLPLTQPITAQFDARGGTIGRADQNTMALPDPERHISRQQAQIRAEGNGFVITNIGSANPITVAGQPLNQGQSTPLHHRDQVRIGGYLLEVAEEGSDADNGATMIRRVSDFTSARPTTAMGTIAGMGLPPEAAPKTPPALSSANPFADLLGDPAPIDGAGGPFGDLMGSTTTPAPPAGGGARSAAPSSSPFDDLIGAAPPSARAGSGVSASPFDDLIGAAPPPARAGSGVSSSPFDDLMAPPPGTKPAGASAFAEPFAGSPSPFGTSASGASPFGASTGKSAAPAPALLPDDFDPFAPPPASTASTASSTASPFPEPVPTGAPSAGFGGAFADLVPGDANRSLDDMFGLQGAGQDPLAGFMAGAAKAVRDSGDRTVPADPLALFGVTPGASDQIPSEPLTPALPDHTSLLRSSFRPPEVRGLAGGAGQAGGMPAGAGAVPGAGAKPSAGAVSAVGQNTAPVAGSAALSHAGINATPGAQTDAEADPITVPGDLDPPATTLPADFIPDTDFGLGSLLDPSSQAKSDTSPIPPLTVQTAGGPPSYATPSAAAAFLGAGVSAGADAFSARASNAAAATAGASAAAMGSPATNGASAAASAHAANARPVSTGTAHAPGAMPASASATAASATATPPTAASDPAAIAANNAALWNAFCEGAGVRMDLPQGLNPDLMRVMGQLLHSAVEGALQMMAVRTATKHELRAQVTVIRSRDNNPLKFSPDPQSALEQLLQPPVRGFLPGPAAMQDAMRDLVGHTIGTMAGTRAALEGVLSRFQPSALESKLTSRSVLDSVLAMNRKAKLWELYLQHYESIRDEAQEDFHTLFGKAFLEAYEDQLERLSQRKSAA